MKFTLSWLKDHLETEASLDDILYALTDLGLEVEEVVDRGAKLAPFSIAKILAAEQHPDADKLRVCQVSNGSETFQVVCGAPNVRPGLKIPFAMIGAELPGDFKIKKAKLRGVESQGMLCSASELQISEDGNGGYHASFSPVRAGARVEEYGPAAIGELDGKLVGDGVQMRLEDAGLGSDCAVQLLREGIELRVQEVFADGCQDYGGMGISVAGEYIKVSR